MDLCQIGNSADHTAPVEYIPNASGVECIYENGVKLVMRDHGWLGLGTCSIRYVGDEGWVETGDSGAMRIKPESLRAEKRLFTMKGTTAYTHVAVGAVTDKRNVTVFTAVFAGARTVR